MTTTTTGTTSPVFQPAPPRGQHRGRHWIDDWRPEDPAFWETTGKAVARRNLAFSTFAEHVGFSVWMLWSRPDDRPINSRRIRLGAHGQPGAVPGRRSQRRRRLPAAALHLRGPGVRRPQLDDHLGGALADPLPVAGLGGGPSRHPVRGAAGCRGDRRLRWRQLRLVDGQHLVLLPGEGQALGAGPQRGGRQHRGRGRAEDHPADRDRGRGDGAVAPDCSTCRWPSWPRCARSCS